jgi:hypothetical protein
LARVEARLAEVRRWRATHRARRDAAPVGSAARRDAGLEAFACDIIERELVTVLKWLRDGGVC